MSDDTTAGDGTTFIFLMRINAKWRTAIGI